MTPAEKRSSCSRITACDTRDPSGSFSSTDSVALFRTLPIFRQTARAPEIFSEALVFMVAGARNHEYYTEQDIFWINLIP
jgi:hypothetical protein